MSIQYSNILKCLFDILATMFCTTYSVVSTVVVVAELRTYVALITRLSRNTRCDMKHMTIKDDNSSYECLFHVLTENT
jgi:hypothetical protein